jgi:hypothetical protein
MRHGILSTNPGGTGIIGDDTRSSINLQPFDKTEYGSCRRARAARLGAI